MMSDQEMNERLRVVFVKSSTAEDRRQTREYDMAVRLCQKHQFTAAAEGLLEAAERMVGIEREEKA